MDTRANRKETPTIRYFASELAAKFSPKQIFSENCYSLFWPKTDSACEVSTFAFVIKINVNYQTKDITISTYSVFSQIVFDKNLSIPRGEKNLFSPSPIL